jgi:hypothetical protein
MYRIIFILLFLSLVYTGFAQGWSTPVNVSNMGTHCNSPKMVVDHNGTIHAVWSSWVTQEYRKIMYSKSENQGDTWSTPIAIADDPEQWFGAPDITCDLQNKLYVSYEGDEAQPSSLLVYIVIYDGTNWSEPNVLSENYPGSKRSHLIADHTGRVYCLWLGWYANGYKIFYRYFENGVWSGIHIPYTEPNYWYFISSVVVDSSNNLHFVGVYKKYSNESGHGNIQYFSYYASTGQWSPLEVVSDTIFDKYNFRDICLDNNQVPHFVWGQKTVPFPGTADATLHRYADASGYLPVDSVETNHYSQYHQLEIDSSNKVYICVNQWTESPNNILRSYLINYRKNNSWVGEIIDSVTGVFYEPHTQMINVSQPGIIYYKGKSLPDTISRDIFFSKLNIYTGTNSIPVCNLTSNPNPMISGTTITYTLKAQCHATLSIIDINGKDVAMLVNRDHPPGTYSYTWQGIGLNGKDVKTGVYIVRLQAGSYMYSYKLLKQ